MKTKKMNKQCTLNMKKRIYPTNNQRNANHSNKKIIYNVHSGQRLKQEIMPILISRLWVGHIKHAQLFVYQSYLNKVVKKKERKEENK